MNDKIKQFVKSYFLNNLHISEQINRIEILEQKYTYQKWVGWKVKSLNYLQKVIYGSLSRIKKSIERTKTELEKLKNNKCPKIRISKHAMYRLNQRFPIKSKFTSETIRRDILRNWERIKATGDWTYKVKTGERTYVISRDLVVITIY